MKKCTHVFILWVLPIFYLVEENPTKNISSQTFYILVSETEKYDIYVIYRTIL